MARFSRELRRDPPDIHAEAQAWLQRYAWPGNVRELRNVLERALILTAGGTLRTEHLPPEIGGSPATAGPDTPRIAAVSLPAAGLRLEEVERDLVRQALDATGGNQVRAARLLGISRDALRTRMKRFGFLSSP